MCEKCLQKKILDYLNSIGAYVRKISLAGRGGVPDIIGCLDGKFFAIEVKAGSRRPTALQQYNLNKIRQAGGEAIVATSLEDVNVMLNKLKGEKE